MICENLQTLRRRMGLSQEQVADAAEVSRQTVAKWERGESTPDLARGALLAELFGVSLDDLANYRPDQAAGLPLPPKGKFIFGPVRVGERGQIVIPVKARREFHIEPGDDLMLLGDAQQGLALLPMDYFMEVFRAIREQEAAR